MQAEIARILEANSGYYRAFVPRPDDPERYDEQTAFVNSQDKGFSILIGGNACLSARQKIFDPIAGKYIVIGKQTAPFHVWSRNPHTDEVEIARASAPFIKGTADIYKVEFSNGEYLECTNDHRVFSSGGEWKAIRQLRRGDYLLLCQPDDLALSESSSEPKRFGYTLGNAQAGGQFASSLNHLRNTTAAINGEATISTDHYAKGGVREDDRHWKQTALDSLFGYQMDRHLYDVRPHASSNIGQFSPPSRSDALIRNLYFQHWDGQDGRAIRDYSTHCDPPSNFQQTCQPVRNLVAMASPCASWRSLRPYHWVGTRAPWSSANSSEICQKKDTWPHHLRYSARQHKEGPLEFSAKGMVREAYQNSRKYSTVQFTKKTLIAREVFYDIHVFPHNNYLCAGVWNHNSGTTECGCNKLAKFVLDRQPPPRKDTPFWIIGSTYEQIINSVWNEKLNPRGGHGHIPESEIEWGRITYYSAKLNMPLAVPLKPWPGKPGKNWLLEFKSYEQGRAKMQARSIGGAFLSEQFPFEILIEIIRGCRESDYNFPGSRWAEYTPVDPVLSIEIEDMIEQDKLPEGWKIYRCNTQCAMEAGHVDKDWFYEFFGSVSEEMRDTRMIGASASYENTIFESFNPVLHCKPIGTKHPSGVKYFRAIDWGAGNEHPFYCAFAYVDGVGAYHFFDEYWCNKQHVMLSEHAQAIKDKFRFNLNSPSFGPTFADPSRPDLFTEFARLGIPCVPANNAIYSSIECVRQHLKVNPTLNEPKLFIDRERCPILTRQMRTYRWRKSKATGLNPQVAKPEPLRRENDAVDGLRYLILSSYRTGTLAPSFLQPAGADQPRKGVGIDRFMRGQRPATGQRKWNQSKRDQQ